MKTKKRKEQKNANFKDVARWWRDVQSTKQEMEKEFQKLTTKMAFNFCN